MSFYPTHKQLKFIMKVKFFTLKMFCLLGLTTTNAQVGIGTNTPSTSAVLELQSTDKGFLPPRMTTAQRSLIATPVEGLIIYNSSNNCLEFFDGTNWISFCDDPSPTTVISGNNREWIDRNLGASRAATSSNDMDSYGDLYQWGRAADGHQLRSNVCPADCYNGNTTPPGVPNFNNDPSNAWYGKFILATTTINWLQSTVANLDDLWQGLNGINNPCPTGFRLPTEAEWTLEYTSWGAQNALGALSSPLKLPYTGRRSSVDGSIVFSGTTGYYWTSTVSNNQVRQVEISSSSIDINTYYRIHANAIRCIKHQ
jgi:uncharacterized protein (TIGR02145 family)